MLGGGVVSAGVLLTAIGHCFRVWLHGSGPSSKEKFEQSINFVSDEISPTRKGGTDFHCRPLHFCLFLNENLLCF